MNPTIFGKIRRKAIQLLAIIAPIAFLTACGGGGGNGGDTLTGGKSGTITLSVGNATMPVQSGSYVGPGSNSPYTTTVIARAYKADGSPLQTGTIIQFMMDGGNTYSGALYPQPFETEDVTQPDGTIVKVPKAFWSYPVESAAGQALMLFQAWDRPGTVTIRASFLDPNSGKEVVGSAQIVVGSPINTGLPSTITASLLNGPIFVANQGLNDAGLIQINVADPVGQPVSNPPAQNVQVQLLNPELGATLLGQGGATGTIVRTTTTNGVTNVSLRTGTIPGVAKLRITADALDNNIDNGIQNPVTADVNFTIEDGRIAALAFTGAFSQAIAANQTTLPLGTGDVFLDGTYLRVVSAIATDSLGNPVQGARIDFSLIDSPIANYPQTAGDFMIQGTNGDPSEGGNLFVAQGANFFTNGARKGDRLVLRPDEQGTNRNLLGSYGIADFLDANRLYITETFNGNNGVNASNVPWIIGRAQYGVIGGSATTDAQGVATTFITYPATRINQRALLTARAGNSRAIVMDARYLGIKDYTMVSSVTEAVSGEITPVSICVFDAIQTPMVGQVLQVTGLIPATSTVAAPITLSPATPVTGADGCANFSIDAKAYVGSEIINLTFSINGMAKPVVSIAVKPQALGDLITGIGGRVNAVTTGPNEREFTVTLIDTRGLPMVGRQVLINGSASDDGAPRGCPPDGSTCSATPAGTIGVGAAFTGVTFEPVGANKTDSNGQVKFKVSYTGNAPFTWTISTPDTAVPPGPPTIESTDYDGDTYTLTIDITNSSGNATVTFPY